MRLVCLILAALLLASCSKREDVTPPASSSMSMDQAKSLARLWAAFGDPERHYANITDTGSMLPTLGSNCIVLLEKVESKDLRVGDIALYSRSGMQNPVCHRVRAINERGSVLFTGDNNDSLKPDGWIEKDRILWRVAGILYTKR